MSSTPRSWTAPRWAGAVCAVRRIRNPIRAARAVMEKSDCVLLTRRRGRCVRAHEPGSRWSTNSYFTTERRVEGACQPEDSAAPPARSGMASEAEKHGTVGAVALDANGNLAAATSTGGFNNKPRGPRRRQRRHRRRHLCRRTASARSPAPARANSSSATPRPTISRRAWPYGGQTPASRRPTRCHRRR